MKIIKLFLRFAIASSFLSAVADRLGYWHENVSVWGNWKNFLTYTQAINPWFSANLIPMVGLTATIAEVVFAICLLIGFKTELFAKLSGFLLLIFALSMMFSSGIKGAFDYSVLSAAAAAFALSTMSSYKYLEVDTILNSKK
ncbi:DoxX family protein [uncultured Flavobacterium sp.]|uniref:DoxX family protein n=1 Tax=uncultured Flavobacterium sp. TaxID=165435 RepID=UPI0030ED1E35